LLPSATLRNSLILCGPSVLEESRMVPPCLIGTLILCPVARPSNVSEPVSSDRVARCAVLAAVSLLVLRESTLDSVASALQNGLCRFQSYEADNIE
jgi:hypothetical protein